MPTYEPKSIGAAPSAPRAIGENGSGSWLATLLLLGGAAALAYYIYANRDKIQKLATLADADRYSPREEKMDTISTIGDALTTFRVAPAAKIDDWVDARKEAVNAIYWEDET